ncbi:uncharacterized protein FFNC_15697 [Fusarium fujikuroi]|nr:uncharacterized protein FFNC_15697 [Fusarium fujikuroi]
MGVKDKFGKSQIDLH